MEFETNRNMVILFTIIFIIGIAATYLAVNSMKNADINKLTDDINELENNIDIKENEIQSLKEKGENFTYHLLKSMSIIDISRENRSNGNFHFDYAARIWYPQKEYQKIIDNCTTAMTYYLSARKNFDLAKDYFAETKKTTTISSYKDILDLYIQLAHSGYSLSNLRYNASSDLTDIAQHLLNESSSGNTTELFELFNSTLMQYDMTYQQGFSQHQDIVDEIEEEYGGFFNPKREP